jgi:hypothetical protein
VAQGVGTEFKPQYWKKKNINGAVTLQVVSLGGASISHRTIYEPSLNVVSLSYLVTGSPRDP